MLELDLVSCSQGPKVQQSFPSHPLQAQTATCCTRIKPVACRIHLAGCQLPIPFSLSSHLSHTEKASSFSRLQLVLLALSSKRCHCTLAKATANCLCKAPENSRNKSREQTVAQNEYKRFSKALQLVI